LNFAPLINFASRFVSITMGPMFKRFEAAREDEPGGHWKARFVAGRDEASRWYLGAGLEPPPTAIGCRAALRQHMPELIIHYDKVCNLVGDDDLAHRILSHYRPPPIVHGCSQAIWLGDEGPALIRNYDFALETVSDRFEFTAWSGHGVIAKAQRPWGGCLDGMNEDGLVASLTAGGGREQGLGFSVILILRYVLETCSSVGQAIVALSRIPIALSQNVTLLDPTGDYATLFLGPNRTPAVSRIRVCANHQETVPAKGRSAQLAHSVQRQQSLLAALEEPAMTLERLTARFFEPPLYCRQAGSTTVYTAVYRPAERRVDYLWPGKRWRQSFARYVKGEYIHDYGESLLSK
jgi:predicted choloylglycine hydrolase